MDSKLKLFSRHYVYKNKTKNTIDERLGIIPDDYGCTKRV